MPLDRIGQHQVRRPRIVCQFAGCIAQMPPSGFQSLRRVEGNKDTVTKTAAKLARLMRTVEAGEQRRVVNQEKQFQRTKLASKLASDPFVNINLGSRRNLDCNDSGIGGINPEQAAG